MNILYKYFKNFCVFIFLIIIPPFPGMYITKSVKIYCFTHKRKSKGIIKIFVCPKIHLHYLYVEKLECQHPAIMLYFFKEPTIESYKGYWHDDPISTGQIIILMVKNYKNSRAKNNLDKVFSILLLERTKQ